MSSSRERLMPRGGLALALLAGSALFVLSASPVGAQSSKRPKVELKIATLAPEGSTWMNMMAKLDAEIRERTEGGVGLRFYPGGIQGDEQVVLRKIRTGQLQGGGLTGVGLGEIAPSLRVLELPFLLRDPSELAAVHAAMDPVFEERLRDAGYTLLGWAEVGFVYLYSKNPVVTTAELKTQKVWIWEGDPLAQAFMEAAGVSAIPLAVTDVLTSLQTGIISTVYITPLACIALQWFTRVRYTIDLPLTHSIGAVVVTNEAWNRIPPEQQAIVRDACAKWFAELAAATTADNQRSMEVIRENGVQSLPPPASEVESFRRLGESVRSKLVGQLYDQATLDRVLAVLEEHRRAAGSDATR